MSGSCCSERVVAHAGLILQQFLFGVSMVLYKLFLPNLNPLTLCLARESGSALLLLLNISGNTLNNLDPERTDERSEQEGLIPVPVAEEVLEDVENVGDIIAIDNVEEVEDDDEFFIGAHDHEQESVLLDGRPRMIREEEGDEHDERAQQLASEEALDLDGTGVEEHEQSVRFLHEQHDLLPGRSTREHHFQTPGRGKNESTIMEAYNDLHVVGASLSPGAATRRRRFVLSDQLQHSSTRGAAPGGPQHHPRRHHKMGRLQKLHYYQNKPPEAFSLSKFVRIVPVATCLWMAQMFCILGVKVYGPAGAVIGTAFQPWQPICTLVLTAFVLRTEAMTVPKVIGILLGICGAFYMIFRSSDELSNFFFKARPETVVVPPKNLLKGALWEEGSGEDGEENLLASSSVAASAAASRFSTAGEDEENASSKIVFPESAVVSDTDRVGDHEQEEAAAAPEKQKQEHEDHDDTGVAPEQGAGEARTTTKGATTSTSARKPPYAQGLEQDEEDEATKVAAEMISRDQKEQQKAEELEEENKAAAGGGDTEQQTAPAVSWGDRTSATAAPSAVLAPSPVASPPGVPDEPPSGKNPATPTEKKLAEKKAENVAEDKLEHELLSFIIHERRKRKASLLEQLSSLSEGKSRSPASSTQIPQMATSGNKGDEDRTRSAKTRRLHPPSSRKNAPMISFLQKDEVSRTSAHGPPHDDHRMKSKQVVPVVLQSKKNLPATTTNDGPSTSHQEVMTPLSSKKWLSLFQAWLRGKAGAAGSTAPELVLGDEGAADVDSAAGSTVSNAAGVLEGADDTDATAANDLQPELQSDGRTTRDAPVRDGDVVVDGSSTTSPSSSSATPVPQQTSAFAATRAPTDIKTKQQEQAEVAQAADHSQEEEEKEKQKAAIRNLLTEQQEQTAAAPTTFLALLASSPPLVACVLFLLNDLGAALYIVGTKSLLDHGFGTPLELTMYSYVFLSLAFAVVVNDGHAPVLLHELCAAEKECMRNPWQLPSLWLVLWLILVPGVTCYLIQNYAVSLVAASKVSFYSILQTAASMLFTAILIWVGFNPRDSESGEHLLQLPGEALLGLVPIVFGLALIMVSDEEEERASAVVVAGRSRGAMMLKK
eukprot:g16663.t1